MKLAFCLFKYFPFGGLQRDFMRIARACLAQGHSVYVYTMEWEGELEPDMHICTIRVKGMQNHSRREDFVKQLQPHLEKENYDLVIGFNKMPGLDIYYAADTCFQAKARAQHNFFYRWTQRYRSSVAFEKAVFSPESKTKILLIAEKQQKEFAEYYQTDAGRFYLLPPGIERDRVAPANAKKIRHAVRKEFGIQDQEFLLLMVGSGFKTKGLDRSLEALAALPEHLRKRCRLFVIGKDHPEMFERLAKKLGVVTQLYFLGGRADVPRFFLAADLLLHPAYNENTGTVLLEALAAGLPVLTTDVCGYAHYIETANAGVVLRSPFEQENLNAALEEMLLSAQHSTRQSNAIEFAKKADIYSLPERAVAIIESLG
jgi:UDP-glucose:(heptosyl)LPS alpha-1,3-glucosyltransferase